LIAIDREDSSIRRACNFIRKKQGFFDFPCATPQKKGACEASLDVIHEALEDGTRTENRFEKKFRKIFSSRDCASRCEPLLGSLHCCKALTRDSLAPRTVVE